MKKVILGLSLLLIILVGAYFVIKNYYHVNPQVAVQLFTPQESQITKLPQGAKLDKPLNIPEGFTLGIFAKLGDASPRVLAFDPQGTLLASLTGKGKVVALPDADKDGIADKVVDVLTGLDRPHGIAFNGNYLYVGESSRVVRYKYNHQTFSASQPEVLFSLPGGGRHFTRTIKILGNKLFVSVGSSCDTCVESDEKRAAILISDLDGKNLKVFARGLRNTVFFAFDSQERIWGNDMGRDFLGDNLPPDELNIISEGKDYGWPYCYGDKVRDLKFESGENQDYCQGTTPPSFYYPAHVAPLGLTFIESELFPKGEQGSLLASFHGSWNSSAPVGYKIVKLTLKNSAVVGSEDFISGWLSGGSVLGRPVDLAFAEDDLLYISDDKANLIYILSKAM